MKVLAISHSCVADVNQQLFIELGRLDDTEVQLIIPARWKSEYSGASTPACLLPTVNFPVYQLPVAAAGHVSFHFYKAMPLRQFRKFKPDVVYSTQEPWSLSNLQALWLAKALRAKFVFHTNQNIFKRLPPPFSWIERLSYRNAAVALAYSEEARQVMLRKGLRGISGVVPYGTDVSMFSPGPSPLRERLGLGTSLVIGYLGRLVPEKGLDTLVQAVAEILKKRPGLDIRVLIVGAGFEEAKLKQMAADAGVTHKFLFVGAVPHREAGDYMRCIDVFVLPSKTMPNWKEQFGRVIIEAMACNIPVVGSNSGQIPYLIRHTGGGLVFQEGDAPSLAEQLLKTLDDPVQRRQLGETGGESVRCHYTYDAVARQLHQILSEVIT